MKNSGLLSTFLGIVAVCGLCANVYAADATAMTGMDATKADVKAADAKPADAKATDAKPADAKATDAKPTDAKATDAKPADAKAAVVAEPKDPLAGVFIAGTAPNQRPAGAPVIKEMKKDKAWYDKAVTGISRPFPWSMKFLENQGNWHTPFTRPGMTGGYDIRGWHKG